MSNAIRFTVHQPTGDRIHHVSEGDVGVVLSRLPGELYARLRVVHFNDRSRGNRILGYVTRGRREIALSALPPRMSLSESCRSLVEKPEVFGAVPGKKWPPLALRRLMLYDVFLHELGHLQLVDPGRKSARLRFARETLAEEFAIEWRHRLWSEPFDHPDPVHNAPSPDELAAVVAGR
jgi:hypothetical protein